MSAIEANALPPGSTVKHYTVADWLGHDHQGCVYRAECDDTEAAVTLYEYLPQGLVIRGSSGVQPAYGKSDAWKLALATYTTRLRAAGLVGHPALPTLDDIWQEGGTVYAAGPWRPGRSLGSELSGHTGPVDARTLTNWARVMCDALSALHHHELIHGNLSPGLLRVLDTGELLLPLVGSTVCTDDAPAWMAPEQHPLNPKPTATGPWTDVYQLSAVLHLAMTRQSPPAVMRRWEGAPLERLAAMGGQYPEGLLTATRKGLSMHPGARQQTIDDWLQEAGLPDRRDKPRYNAGRDEESAELLHFGRGGATAAVERAQARTEGGPSVPAPQAPMSHGPQDSGRPLVEPAAVNAGHQPLSETVQARLERLDPKREDDKTPPWVWVSVAVALLALAGIVLLS